METQNTSPCKNNNLQFPWGEANLTKISPTFSQEKGTCNFPKANGPKFPREMWCLGKMDPH
jgi:hypothetical protein